MSLRWLLWFGAAMLGAALLGFLLGEIIGVFRRVVREALVQSFGLLRECNGEGETLQEFWDRQSPDADAQEGHTSVEEFRSGRAFLSQAEASQTLEPDDAWELEELFSEQPQEAFDLSERVPTPDEWGENDTESPEK